MSRSSRSAAGWVGCACGSRHWGRLGAAGLLLTDPDRSGVVLQQRSRLVHRGGTWSVPGGAIEPGESVVDAALREAHEEAGIGRGDLTVVTTVDGIDHGSWSYRYVIAESTAPRPSDDVFTAAGSTSWEATQTRWVDLEAVSTYALHPGLRHVWARLHAELVG